MNLEQILNELSPEKLAELLANHPPWWVYAIFALIPLSLFYVARETWCWFFKINHLRSHLARIELLLQELIRLEQQSQQQKRTDAFDKLIER